MEKIKILVVDDDQDMRETYAEVFKKEGFEVTEAIDGIDGLDKATTMVPDVIFTGIIMPRMDGFGLKDALAKNVTTANIPVMMSSHMGREEDRVKAQQMGIGEFFVQGMITPIEVVEKVRSMFGGGKYMLKFDPAQLDAQKLAGDMLYASDFECKKCSAPLALSMEISDADNHIFSARFVCPKCGQTA